MPIDHQDLQKQIVSLANHLIDPEFFFASFKRAPDSDAFVLGLYDKEHNSFVETLIPTPEIHALINTTGLLLFIEQKLLRMKLQLLKYRVF